MRAALREHRGTALGVVISVVSIASVAIWASGQEAPSFPSDAGGLGLVAAAIGIYAALTLVRAWRWEVILHRGGVPARFGDVASILTIGYMGNTVLPARGGEALRMVLMAGRTGSRMREVLGAILPERLLDVLALGLAFVTVTFADPDVVPTGELTAVLTLVLIVAAVAGAFAYLHLRRRGRFAAFAEKVRPVAKASRTLLTPLGALLLLVSVGVWLGEAAVFLCVTRALDVDVSLFGCLAVVVIGSFTSLIPAGPGFAGTYDGALLVALKALDVTGGAALSCVLLLRFVVFVPITLAGAALLVARYGGLRELRRPRPAATAVS